VYVSTNDFVDGVLNVVDHKFVFIKRINIYVLNVVVDLFAHTANAVVDVIYVVLTADAYTVKLKPDAPNVPPALRYVNIGRRNGNVVYVIRVGIL